MRRPALTAISAASQPPNESPISVSGPSRQGVEKAEIEMNEVVHRAEIRGTRRAAEAGVRRCDELCVTSEQLDDGQPWIDVLKTVKQQQRIARAAAQDFELDAGDRVRAPRPAQR